MKKVVFLVLAVVLMFSAVALADGYANDAAFGRIGTNDSTYVKDNYKNTEKATLHTRIYMIVDAQGQINVTVPLSLAFATDVDGGFASVTGYKITNNGKNAVKITKIVVTNEADAGLTLVKYQATPYTSTDTYGVQLAGDTTIDTYDCTGAGNTSIGWQISRESNDVIVPTMVTGPISYVTKGNEENKDYVHVMSISYTVELDYTTKGSLTEDEIKALTDAQP